MAEKYGQDYAWDIGIGAWRQWIGTHWELLPDAEALDLITVAVLHELGIAVMSMNKVDATVRLARDLCQRRFLPRQGLVNFQNGTFDTSPMRFWGHERADDLLACLPYPYAATQAFGRIERFLEMTIPDPDGRQAYMAHLGESIVFQLMIDITSGGNPRNLLDTAADSQQFASVQTEKPTFHCFSGSTRPSCQLSG